MNLSRPTTSPSDPPPAAGTGEPVRSRRSPRSRRRTVAAVSLLVAGVAGGGLYASTASAADQTPTPAPKVPTAVATPERGTVVREGRPEGADEAEVAPFVSASVHYGGKITRAQVMARANDWLKRNVPYSQKATAWDMNHGKQYRTDCSGFVSMAWALTSSRTTSTLPGVSTRIAWQDLKPGDVVDNAGEHVQLFEKWANHAHTEFWIIDEGSTATDMNHFKVTINNRRDAGFVPYRYKNIVD